MTQRCAVLNCENGPAPGRSFFRFPKDPALRMKWIVFAERGKDYHPDEHNPKCVCTDHFTPDDYTNNMQFEMGLAARRILKPDAIPSIKKLSSRKEALRAAREKRLQKRAYKKIVEALLKEHDSSGTQNEGVNEQQVPDANQTADLSTKNEAMETDFPKVNNFENDPFETTEILIERIPKADGYVDDTNPLEECEEIPPTKFLINEGEDYLESDKNVGNEIDEDVESDKNITTEEGYYNLQMEVERLQKQVETLQKENSRLQDTEKKYLKYLSAIKKKYLTTLKTAQTKYLESESKYLQEISSLKERLEKAEYENLENKLYFMNED